jgi:hypothetical protein
MSPSSSSSMRATTAATPPFWPNGPGSTTPNSYEPGEADLNVLQDLYFLEDDDRGDAMSGWFTIAGELHARGTAIPEEWQYRPGLSPVDFEDHKAPLIASATTATLMRFVEDIEDDVKRFKAEGRDD